MLMVTGELLPAPFMAVMLMVKSLFSSSPVRVYIVLLVGATNVTLLPIIPQPLMVNEYENWYESTAGPDIWTNKMVIEVVDAMGFPKMVGGRGRPKQKNEDRRELI